MRRLGLTGSARCMIKETVRKLVDKPDRHSVSEQRRSLARSKCCSVCNCCRTHLAQLALRGCHHKKFPRNHKQKCRVARLFDGRIQVATMHDMSAAKCKCKSHSTDSGQQCEQAAAEALIAAVASLLCEPARLAYCKLVQAACWCDFMQTALKRVCVGAQPFICQHLNLVAVYLLVWTSLKKLQQSSVAGKRAVSEAASSTASCRMCSMVYTRRRAWH